MTDRLIIAYGLIALGLLALAILDGQASFRRRGRRSAREHLRVDLFADRGRPMDPVAKAPIAPLSAFE